MRRAISRMKQTPSAIDNPIIAIAPRTPSLRNPATARVDVKDPLWMKLGAFVFYTVCALVLWWGWEVRDQHYISAKFGVGYLLGIVGTTLTTLTR